MSEAEFTRKFSLGDQRDMEIKAILSTVYQALQERKAILEAAAMKEQAAQAASEALEAAGNAPDQAVAAADMAIATAEEAMAEAAEAALTEDTDAVSEAEVEAADNQEQA